MYSMYGKSSITWICLKCGIPNVSSSQTVDITTFETVNPFSVLTGSPRNQPNMSTPLKMCPPNLKDEAACMNVSSVSSHIDTRFTGSNVPTIVDIFRSNATGSWMYSLPPVQEMRSGASSPTMVRSLTRKSGGVAPLRSIVPLILSRRASGEGFAWVAASRVFCRVRACR